MRTEQTIGDRPCYLYGPADADTLLIQPVDDHDLEGLDAEVEQIRKLSGTDQFRLIAFKVQDWDQELAPWPAPAAFGDRGFGDGAPDTLRFVLEELCRDAGTIYIGGYSLAGFFALWAAYQTDRFRGSAAVSPSVWYPGWVEYAREHACRADRIYLSLGKKEEKTRNRLMAQVGDAIRFQAQLLEGNSILEWNDGNHFREPDVRTAKGFAWLLRQ